MKKMKKKTGAKKMGAKKTMKMKSMKTKSMKMKSAKKTAKKSPSKLKLVAKRSGKPTMKLVAKAAAMRRIAAFRAKI